MYLEMQLLVFSQMRNALLPWDKSSYDEQWKPTRSGELEVDPAKDWKKESTRKTQAVPQKYDEVIFFDSIYSN